MKRTQQRRLEAIARLVVVASLILVAVAMTASSAQAAPKGPKPLAKNIIIMIADGSGYNHNIAADLYQYGEVGLQPWENFPFQFAVSTYSADGRGYDPALAWGDYTWVMTRYTDSAAAATAMACGVKTYDAAIGVDPAKNPVKNILEIASDKDKGKSTGVVTTVEFSHATPAGFVAHNIDRNNYEQIAQEMVLQSGADVIMGAGNPWFNNDGQPIATANTYKYVGGKSTWDALVAGTVKTDTDGDGDLETSALIQDRSEFQALMSGPTPERVVGVAKVYETMQQARSGDRLAAPYVVPRTSTVPTLSEMARAALNVLDNNPKGFVLMIEGGAVDYAAHAGQPGRTIEERIDFNQAIEAVLAWVQQNSNWGETLLIVTADHETGYLWGPGSGAPATWVPLVSAGVGVQPAMQFGSPNHTNSLVPLWAKGDAGRLFRPYATHTDPVRGLYINNIDIFKVMSDALK